MKHPRAQRSNLKERRFITWAIVIKKKGKYRTPITRALRLCGLNARSTRGCLMIAGFLRAPVACTVIARHSSRYERRGMSSLP
jgi:hypothetical protein